MFHSVEKPVSPYPALSAMRGPGLLRLVLAQQSYFHWGLSSPKSSGSLPEAQDARQGNPDRLEGCWGNSPDLISKLGLRD